MGLKIAILAVCMLCIVILQLALYLIGGSDIPHGTLFSCRPFAAFLCPSRFIGLLCRKLLLGRRTAGNFSGPSPGELLLGFPVKLLLSLPVCLLGLLVKLLRGLQFYLLWNLQFYILRNLQLI